MFSAKFEPRGVPSKCMLWGRMKENYPSFVLDEKSNSYNDEAPVNNNGESSFDAIAYISGTKPQNVVIAELSLYTKPIGGDNDDISIEALAEQHAGSYM